MKIGYLKTKITQIWFKNKNRIKQFEGKITLKIRTAEPQRKFTGFYKKKCTYSVHNAINFLKDHRIHGVLEQQNQYFSMVEGI